MTNKWGPNLWASLNAIVRNYPEDPTENDKSNFKAFFLSLGHVLPCQNCREHYIQYISGVNWGDILKNRVTIVDFIIHFHNSVNERIGKTVVDYTTAIQMVYNTSNYPEFSPMNIVILLLCIVIISLLLNKK